jgi:hypothetical protein
MIERHELGLKRLRKEPHKRMVYINGAKEGRSDIESEAQAAAAYNFGPGSLKWTKSFIQLRRTPNQIFSTS